MPNNSKFLKLLRTKPPPAKKGEVNYPFVDRFSLVHFMLGVSYGLLGFGFLLALLLALLWEVIENPLKVYLPAVFPRGSADTLQNSVGDVLAVILGWTAIHYFLGT